MASGNSDSPYPSFDHTAAMKTHISALVGVLACVQSVLSSAYTSGFYTEAKITNYQCYSDLGYEFQQVCCYRAGQFTDYCISNMNMAIDYGISSDVYIAPDGLVDPYQLAQDVQKRISSHLFDSLYVDTTNLSLTIQQNCDYLQSLVGYLQLIYPHNEIRMFGYQQLWIQNFGGRDICSQFTQLALNYWHSDHLPDRNDWPSQSFGGWNQPTEKQFDTSSDCTHKTVRVARF